MLSTRFSRLAAALLAAVALPASAGSEDSFRCTGGLIAVGDPKIDLLGKCGEPTLEEVASAEEIGVVREDARQPGGATQRTTRETAAIERWTYDLGKNQFIRIVTLDGGRVRSIRAGGRGYTEEEARERRPLPVATCDHLAIRVGDESYALLARCGAPATRDVRLLERAVTRQEGDETVERSVTVPIEVWGYHFGPQTLTRIVELEDGRVVKVETSSRGYAP